MTEEKANMTKMFSATYVGVLPYWDRKKSWFIKLVYAKKCFNTFLQIASFINDSFWILIFVHKMMWNSKKKKKIID